MTSSKFDTGMNSISLRTDAGISSDDTYMIFEAVEDEDGAPQLAEIDDDELLDELAEIFAANIDAEAGNSEEQ